MRIDNDGFPVCELTGEIFVPDGENIATTKQAIQWCRMAEGRWLKAMGCKLAEALKLMRQGVTPEVRRERVGFRTIDNRWFDNEAAAIEHSIVVGAEQRALRRLRPVLAKAG